MPIYGKTYILLHLELSFHYHNVTHRFVLILLIAYIYYLITFLPALPVFWCCTPYCTEHQKCQMLNIPHGLFLTHFIANALNSKESFSFIITKPSFGHNLV